MSLVVNLQFSYSKSEIWTAYDFWFWHHLVNGYMHQVVHHHISKFIPEIWKIQRTEILRFLWSLKRIKMLIRTVAWSAMERPNQERWMSRNRCPIHPRFWGQSEAATDVRAVLSRPLLFFLWPQPTFGPYTTGSYVINGHHANFVCCRIFAQNLTASVWLSHLVGSKFICHLVHKSSAFFCLRKTGADFMKA